MLFTEFFVRPKPEIRRQTGSHQTQQVGFSRQNFFPQTSHGEGSWTSQFRMVTTEQNRVEMQVTLSAQLLASPLASISIFHKIRGLSSPVGMKALEKRQTA